MIITPLPAPLPYDEARDKCRDKAVITDACAVTVAAMHDDPVMHRFVTTGDTRGLYRAIVRCQADTLRTGESLRPLDKLAEWLDHRTREGVLPLIGA